MTIRILDVEYKVLAEDEPEKVERIAGFVDRKIRDVRQSNSTLTTLSASVLTALNLTEELFRVQEQLEESRRYAQERVSAQELKSRLEAVTSRAAASEENSAVLAARLESVQKDNDELNSLIEDYKERFRLMRQELEAGKKDVADLQNKLLENQIELIRARKMLLDYGAAE